MEANDRLKGLDYEFYKFNKVTYENQKVVYSKYLPLFDDCAFMLDLGCGKGDFQVMMAERGKVCLGVDSDPKMCEEARSRGVNVECRDALEFLREQPEGRFDCIFAAHLVEHLPFEKVIELADNSLRALKPGGMLLLTTPNVRSLWPHLEDFYLHFGHVRFYHPRCIEFFLQNAGFAGIETGENNILKGHLFGEQANLLNGLNVLSPVSVNKEYQQEAGLEELVKKSYLPDGFSKLSLVKRLKWKLRFGIASLMSPFFEEVRRQGDSALRIEARTGFGEAAVQLNAHRKVLNDIIERLDSPSEAYVKAIKPRG